MQPRPPRETPVEVGRGRPYELHLFVCTDGPECPTDGPAVAIRDALKRRAKEMGLKDVVRVNRSGCLNQCGHGPMMVVYPEAVWYSHLDVATALKVLEAHVHGEGPLPPHRFLLGPGACKALRAPDGTSTCHGACHGTG